MKSFKTLAALILAALLFLLLVAPLATLKLAGVGLGRVSDFICRFCERAAIPILKLLGRVIS